MAVSAAALQDLHQRVRQAFALPQSVTSPKKLYQAVVDKLEALSEKGTSVPENAAVAFKDWKDMAEQAGLLETTAVQATQPVTQLLSPEETQLLARLDELREKLCETRRQRRKTFTSWMINDAAALDEAHKIHRQLGDESKFWDWAEAQLHLHANTIRMMYKIRDACEGMVELPEISMGDLQELARCPEEHLKPMLRGELLCNGVPFWELPGRSNKQMSLQKWIDILKQEAKLKLQNGAKKEAADGTLPAKSTGPLLQQRFIGTGSVDPLREPLQAGYEPVESPGPEPELPEGLCIGSKVAHYANDWHNFWNSNKKDLVDGLVMGSLKPEGYAELKEVLRLAHEIIAVLHPHFAR